MAHEIAVGFTYSEKLTTDQKDRLASFLRSRMDGLANNLEQASKSWAKKNGVESLGSKVFFVRVD